MNIIDGQHRRILDETLAVLAEKLSSASTTLQKVVDRNTGAKGFFEFPLKVRRNKWLLEKKSLDAVIHELEDWQRRFDPSWFLIMRLANPIVDHQLQVARAALPAPSSSNPSSSRTKAQSPLSLADGIRHALRPDPPKSVLLPQRPLETTAIPFCKAAAACLRTPTKTKWYIIDTLHLRAGQDPEALERDVRNLYKKLSGADPFAFGLLKCKGAVPLPGARGYELVLNAPEEGMEALQSLRHVLLNPQGAHARLSLTRRVRIAQDLARSVSYVHTFGFVHKNICPEAVLTFTDQDAAADATFLVGFGDFRAADGGTFFLKDMAWEREIYRHPARQGEIPGVAYKMQHDIYSLGVCLLEIGLWEAFVDYTADANPRPKYGQMHQDFLQWLKEIAPEVMSGRKEAAFSLGLAGIIGDRLKDYMVHLARTKLPEKVGDRYAEVVSTCLTCLDQDNDFGDEDEFTDADEIRVGVRFIETVLGRLNEITL